MIDYDSIKATYDRLMEQRAEDRRRQREEDRQAKLDELRADEEKTPEEVQEEMDKWDEDRDAEDEASDENDPEKPNYDEMLEKEKETLKERREKDEAFTEEFGNALKEKGVIVIDDIKADVSAQYVFVKLLDKIKDNFLLRHDLIEKQQAEALKPEEVPFYEKSYIYKHSKFG
jgi:archaellum component FlaD/FlaE